MMIGVVVVECSGEGMDLDTIGIVVTIGGQEVERVGKMYDSVGGFLEKGNSVSMNRT